MAPPWRDLVFHVLAHVGETAHLPSSVFSAGYVAFVEGSLGSAANRSLAEDCRLLGQILNTHESLARAQVLAWLFDDLEQIAATRDCELTALDVAHVANAEALATLCRDIPALEILRAAAELEADHYLRLPPVAPVSRSLGARLGELGRVAPMLPAFRVRLCRALGVRGRAFAGEIVVGCPGSDGGPTVEHAAWQAAHEATVMEVAQHAHLAERNCETAALVLLGERATAAQLVDPHAVWLAHLGNNVPLLDRENCPGEVIRAVDTCLAANGSTG